MDYLILENIRMSAGAGKQQYQFGIILLPQKQPITLDMRFP